MSDENAKPDTEPKDKDTTARYVWKTEVLLLTHTGQPIICSVSTRDVNKVFDENPSLVENFNAFVLLKFFDKMYSKVKAEDGLEYNNEGGRVRGSPILYLPGWGRIYTIEEVQDKDDQKSREIFHRLKLQDLTAGFLNKVTDKLLPADPLNGDRILEEHEITNFKMMAGVRESNLKPAPEPEEPKKRPERKRIFPITPDKNPVN